MTYPHRRFIAYLIGLGLDDAEIGRMLTLDELVTPAVAELARIRFDLADQPQPLRAFDRNHRASADWVVQQGITGLVRRRPAVAEALSVLRSPVLRQPAELLLLGGHPPAILPRFCKDHDLPDVSEEGAAHFRHYFWDVQGMAMDEWAEFLRVHPNGEVYRQALAEGHARALTLADLFAQRMKKMPNFGTIPGATGGAFVKPPPMFRPTPGPDLPLVEP